MGCRNRAEPSGQRETASLKVEMEKYFEVADLSPPARGAVIAGGRGRATRKASGLSQRGLEDHLDDAGRHSCVKSAGLESETTFNPRSAPHAM